MKSFTLFIFLCTTFVGIPSVFTYAADYALSPLIIDQPIEPRDSFEETIKITNTTDRKIRLFPTVNEITLGSEGAVERFIPASMGDNSVSVTSWISITRARIEISPGETIKVPVTVQVNPNAVPGEYHAFIGFAEGSKRDEAEAKVMAGTAPGTVIRLSLTEKRTEYLRLEQFIVDRFITSLTRGEATYQLENVGGLPLTPTGEIIFYSNNGVEKAAITLNQDARTIAPGAKETFTVKLPDDLGVIGRYKAFLNIEYGTKQRANLYDTVYFNIIPLYLLATIFFALISTSALLALRYHRNLSQDKDDDEQVAVYVRTGVRGTEKDHDINLKN